MYQSIATCMYAVQHQVPWFSAAHGAFNGITGMDNHRLNSSDGHACNDSCWLKRSYGRALLSRREPGAAAASAGMPLAVTAGTQRATKSCLSAAEAPPTP